ncbi:MAG TPA: hypothetical protein VFV10_05615 [Gammaproteobacteria bacterium]|nr:hypothetical protein [Gammaproteobacteria bacterium]
MKHVIKIVGMALAFAGVSALAEEPSDGAAYSTITVIPQAAELPDAVTKEIVLPDEAADAAREHSAEGLAKANEARADGRAFGQATAAAAREHAEDAAEESDEAAENGAHGHEVAEAAREAAAAAHEASDAAHEIADAAHEAADAANEVADAAREDGRAFGEATAAAAAESREDLEHRSTPDLGSLLPDNVPDVAHIPDRLPPTPEHP